MLPISTIMSLLSRVWDKDIVASLFLSTRAPQSKREVARLNFQTLLRNPTQVSASLHQVQQLIGKRLTTRSVQLC